jgi:transposase
VPVTRTVDIDATTLWDRRIGAAPIVDRFVERCGLYRLFDDYLPTDPRATLAPSVPLLALISNLVIERAPAYKIAEWATGRSLGALGTRGCRPELLTDDRLGRSLDALFEADRASMLTALMTGVITTFSIATDELHNDATTLSLHGAYANGTGASARAPLVTFGHAKERPDLAQLIWLLTVSADGNVPITYRMADGNTSEDKTHIATWEECCTLANSRSFLYVADAKLCNRDAMGYIDTNEGRFVTVMPRTRTEDKEFRRHIATNTVAWHEVLRCPARRKDDPEVVFWTTPAPSCSVEGYRIVWVKSSDKETGDAATRHRRIEAAREAITELNAKLSGPRARLKDSASVHTAATAAVDEAKASRWVRPEAHATTTSSYRQKSRGRPGPHTEYVRIDKEHFTVEAVILDDVVRFDAASDGCWPLMSNDKVMTDAELFFAYKRQPGVERPHHVLKGVINFTPMYLKSNERIDAFGFLGYVALVVHALIERTLRRAMRDEGITSLALYPEDRHCTSPTAARVIEIFEPLCAHDLIEQGAVVKTYDPLFTKLHRQILDLLGVPASAYMSARTAAK